MVLHSRRCYSNDLSMTLISFPDIVINARQDKGKRFISFKEVRQRDIGQPLTSLTLHLYVLC